MSLLDLTRRAFTYIRNAIAVLLLFCSVVDAQTGAHSRWSLHFYGDGFQDEYLNESCGTLDKFRSDPKPFDFDHWATPPVKVDRDEVRTERLGEISGFAVYTVTHNISMSGLNIGVGNGSLVVAMKMILVERKPGNVCAICEEENQLEEVTFMPAYFINAGEEVLATNDLKSGNAGLRTEAYWTFDKDRPVPLDLDPITEAAGELVPEGYSLPDEIPVLFSPERDRPRNLETLNFDSMACRQWNGKFPAGPCVFVHLEFQVKDSMLVVTFKSVVQR